MTTALLIVCIVLGVLNVALLALLFYKMRGGTEGAVRESLRRLEEKADSTFALADYTSRTADNLSRSTEARLDRIQSRLAEDIKYIVDVNAQNLERIRRTVDEKLASSLDGKLSESYALISDRLEKMYRSVGEMHSLSGDVSDIKRVFTNVKLRGTWGEAQLDAILSQMLAPEQYEQSVQLNPLTRELADFAILMPTKDEPVYLPIDSKFPVEEYERLAQASAAGDAEGADRARKNLERAVKLQAESIAKKYILPPRTTDFALMFLPSEALYAEVVSIAGVSDFLRAKRVIACGPTNLAALLSVLQTGFRSAAIERRSGELRELLDAFRHDFAAFADVLSKTRKKLQEAQEAVENAEKRTGKIGRRLDSFRAVGESSSLPPDET